MTVKTLLLLALIVAVGMLAGWITFSQSSGKTTITIDNAEIKKDATKAVDEGKRLMHEATEGIKQNSPTTPASPTATPVHP